MPSKVIIIYSIRILKEILYTFFLLTFNKKYVILSIVIRFKPSKIYVTIREGNGYMNTIDYFYINYLCSDSDDIDKIIGYFQLFETDSLDTLTLFGKKNPSTLDRVIYVIRAFGNSDTLKNLEERKTQIEMFHRELNVKYSKFFKRVLESREFDEMPFIG